MSLAAAVASNTAFVNRGIGGRLSLNLGVVLIGRSAIRKSSALSFMQRFAGELNLNYGPTDTGGARQGIMAAMQTRWQDDAKDGEPDVESLEQLAATNFDSIITRMERPRLRPSSIYFVSKELGRLLTSQTRELLDFFADGLDRTEIFYQTKLGSIRIPNPMINLIGATTPGNLPVMLPRDAPDHGLLSRLIFVYASKAEKDVPIPPQMDRHELARQARLIEHLQTIASHQIGEIVMSPEAEAEYRNLYAYDVKTKEYRLNAYAGRRNSDHLARVAALLCLLRGQMPFVISREDIGLAHAILVMTESQMDGAYVGLDKTVDGRAYAHLREFMESMPGLTKHDHLAAMLIRLGHKPEEATTMLGRFVQSHRLIQHGIEYELQTKTGNDVLAVYITSLISRLNKDYSGL